MTNTPPKDQSIYSTDIKVEFCDKKIIADHEISWSSRTEERTDTIKIIEPKKTSFEPNHIIVTGEDVQGENIREYDPQEDIDYDQQKAFKGGCCTVF